MYTCDKCMWRGEDDTCRRGVPMRDGVESFEKTRFSYGGVPLHVDQSAVTHTRPWPTVKDDDWCSGWVDVALRDAWWIVRDKISREELQRYAPNDGEQSTAQGIGSGGL